MAEVPRRPLEIKGTLEIQPTDIADRLKKIEEKLEAAKGRAGDKDFLGQNCRHPARPELSSSIILALVGFMLTGAISNSVQQTADGVWPAWEKMQSLISALSDPMIPEKDEDVDTTTPRCLWQACRSRIHYFSRQRHSYFAAKLPIKACTWWAARIHPGCAST